MRRGENIFKRKDGRWEGRYICGRHEDGSAKYRSVYAHSYLECSEKLTKAKMSRLPTNKSMTVSELFNAWLLSRKNSVKQSTYATYRAMYDYYVHERLGGCKVNSLNSYLLNVYVDELLTTNGRRGKPISAATVQSVLIFLRSVFTYGEVEYGIENSAKNISMPKSDVHEIEIFKPDEIEKIKSAADLDNSYYLGILLCLYTGLRIGELCALRWENIDTENSLLKVRKTLSRIRNPDGEPKTIVIIDAPKSRKSIRDIPLPTCMLEQLADMKKLHNSDDFFLTGASKNTEPRSYQYHYKKLLESAGVPYRKFHNLRHTFATTCIRKGVDVKTVSELLGHSSVKITLERYMHSDLESKREQLAGLYE
ncbi:site-specific integrase [Ruminococcus sp.]|uniref:tyrosine-type recombinase/integrase n=1 Tax=Ruminococcus sp. TaxID=41978 RepID=UPI001B2BCAAC|nr:site-specific integrase [Ruminococcus sp.]MBO5559098.1 site-specific integrase [Ruminococcus sp.]